MALALLLLIVQPALAQKKLTAAEAKDHMGETATVCGNVVSTRYAASTEGQSTFLYLDQTYPDKIFAVVIWGSKRSKFGKFATPEVEYRERKSRRLRSRSFEEKAREDERPHSGMVMPPSG